MPPRKLPTATNSYRVGLSTGVPCFDVNKQFGLSHESGAVMSQEQQRPLLLLTVVTAALLLLC